MATESNGIPPPDKWSTVARNGNVVCIVGAQCKKIQVSSSVLENASPYFSNMFGPNFLEGLDLHRPFVKTISMPEDDAVVMERIFQVLHLRNDILPEVLEPREIFEFAVAADKFDCLVAVQNAARLWLDSKKVMKP